MIHEDSEKQAKQLKRQPRISKDNEAQPQVLKATVQDLARHLQQPYATLHHISTLAGPYTNFLAASARIFRVFSVAFRIFAIFKPKRVGPSQISLIETSRARNSVVKDNFFVSMLVLRIEFSVCRATRPNSRYTPSITRVRASQRLC